MLETKQIKFLKRCSIYPKLLIAGLVSMLTSGFAAILFDMIVSIGSDYSNPTLRSLVDVTGLALHPYPIYCIDYNNSCLLAKKKAPLHTRTPFFNLQ
ncbi:hypothetical protein [Pseudobutyrivibrio sp.]|uniref:hypothetical protein n=1 Tax=Pseudobutyrivibrio sp. TaxID=2014367 RepID=UPI001DE34B39|nr:hypothetical protein [Pseudobutyrivibrio sp.]MBE5911207.1 hypothetical protein [Pseudobutyrivibrio sp.]